MQGVVIECSPQDPHPDIHGIELSLSNGLFVKQQMDNANIST
jgi:hypothetical protein